MAPSPGEICKSKTEFHLFFFSSIQDYYVNSLQRWYFPSLLVYWQSFASMDGGVIYYTIVSKFVSAWWYNIMATLSVDVAIMFFESKHVYQPKSLVASRVYSFNIHQSICFDFFSRTKPEICASLTTLEWFSAYYNKYYMLCESLKRFGC